MDVIPHALLAAIAIYLVAGTVKGVLGMGLPSVALGLSSLVMAPAEAAALMVIPAALTNIWQFVAGPHKAALWRRLWPSMIAILLGTWAGVAAGLGIGAAGSAAQASIALGLALVVYALYALSPLRMAIAPRKERWLGPLCGTLTGALSAATGVFAIPAVPYLQAIGLERDALVQALGLSFSVSTLALAGGLLHDGALDAAVIGPSLAALGAALAGMAAGQRVRGLIRPESFRVWFLLGLAALGAHLALRPLL